MIPRRYLLLVSATGEEAAHAAVRTGLTKVCQTPRMTLFAEDVSACVPLESGEGAFIGTLFSAAPGGERVLTVPRGRSHAIMASNGQAALSAYWGGYVLACENAHLDAISVARDPSGAMPCFMASAGGVTAFASDPQTLVSAGLIVPSIDYPALLHHLVYPDLCLAETCLAGLQEVLPGMRFESGSGAARIGTWWSPWAFTDDPIQASFAESSTALREVVDRCITAWSSCCDGALVTLSGGLDSSIVSSALARSGVKVAALNMIGEGAVGDERAYAALVCRHLGIPLAEARYDAESVDLRTTSAVNRARPVGVAHMQPLEAAMRLNAGLARADALFNGMAGDSIFCSMRSALPVADAVLAHRSPRQIWRTVRNVASLADVSPVAVVRQAARMVMRGRRPVGPAATASFLSQKGTDMMAVQKLPPWLAPPAATFPGRAYHVEMIARVGCFVEGLDRWNAPPTVVPLLSQPVLELCLRIPSWHWVAGGKDRAVAREAYRHWLPDEIVDRGSKGGPGATEAALCLDNLPLLREILLDGRLARQGLLDRPSLEYALEREVLLQHGGHSDILSLAEAEAWIAYWTRVRTGSGGRDHGPDLSMIAPQSLPS